MVAALQQKIRFFITECNGAGQRRMALDKGAQKSAPDRLGDAFLRGLAVAVQDHARRLSLDAHANQNAAQNPLKIIW